MTRRKVRYAVVGLGHIAQAAVLPAFKNARSNSVLTALVSGSPEKRTELSQRYEVPHTCDYDGYDRLLESGEVDAVYIALPNDMHHEYTLRAADAGVHVLCEKPLGLSVRECEEMVQACADAGVKLMTAYRLHFEKSTLRALELVAARELGEPRFFSSTFSMQVTDLDNIRLKRERGGGPLFDLGVYCINQARNLFRTEPAEVSGFEVHGDGRFREVPEATSAVLRFPGDRLATFICSFGAADTSACHIIGSTGDLRMEPAFEYAGALQHRLTINGVTRRRKFPRRDQFAPELISFSRCVLEDIEPEPSGVEGLADVRVMEAVQESIATRKTVALEGFQKLPLPGMDQELTRPPVKEPELIQATSPHST